MALVLTTTLRIGSDKTKGDVKVVEEGTPYGDLTAKEKKLAKELGLLAQAPDEVPDLEEEIEAEDAETEDSEDE